MERRILLILFFTSSVAATKAQDSAVAQALQFSGSADAYFRYDFNNPKNAPYNNFTSFTNSQNSFELGMISFQAAYSKGKTGVLADIGFGKRPEEFSYNDAGSGIAIKQLFFTYAPASRLKFSLGSWGTHIGYELVDAYLNRNYSMSYLFSYGPFFHTGFKGEFQVGEKTTIMAGITDPYDLKYATGLPKMLIGQISTASGNDKLTTCLSYQGGKFNDTSRLYQGDVVIRYRLSSQLSLGYNGTLQSRQSYSSKKWQSDKIWFGSALYVNADAKSWLDFTLRGEYINDSQNVLGFNTDIFEATLSANVKIDNLTLIPEIRFEKAGKHIYSIAEHSAVDKTGNFIIAAVYHF